MSLETRTMDDVLAVTDHQAGERVSQIVEANSSYAGALKRRKEATLHQVRVMGCPSTFGKMRSYGLGGTPDAIASTPLREKPLWMSNVPLGKR